MPTSVSDVDVRLADLERRMLEMEGLHAHVPHATDGSSFDRDELGDDPEED